jgi:hypothetical protein
MYNYNYKLFLKYWWDFEVKNFFKVSNISDIININKINKFKIINDLH